MLEGYPQNSHLLDGRLGKQKTNHWSRLVIVVTSSQNSCSFLKWKPCLGNIRKAAEDAQAYFEQYGIKEEQQAPIIRYLLGTCPPPQPSPCPSSWENTQLHAPKQTQMWHHWSLRSYREWWPNSNLNPQNFPLTRKHKGCLPREGLLFPSSFYTPPPPHHPKRNKGKWGLPNSPAEHCSALERTVWQHMGGLGKGDIH